MNSRPLRTLALLLGAVSLQAQNPAAGNNNMAWQMQQQQFQAQRMFQMQQQMHRQVQMQQQMMSQQRMQAQMAAQQAMAQRIRQQETQEMTARRAIALPPSLLSKPAGEAWQAALGQTRAFPAFDGERLVVVTKEPRCLRSLDLATGKALWEVPLPDKLALDPLLVGDSLIYATKDQLLAILDANTGRDRHLLQLDALDTYLMSNRSSHARVLYPAIDGDRIILSTYGKGHGTPTGWIYAIDLPTGKVQWKVDFPGGPDLIPIIAGDRVLAGGAGRVLALNLADGKQLWECRLSGSAEITEGPLLAGTYAVISEQKVHAIDVAKGTLLWSTPFSGRPILQGEGDRLIYSDFRGLFIRREWLVALDAKTGKQAWELKLGESRIPWIQEGKVLCNSEATLMALDLATGKQVWSRTLPEAPSIPLAVFGESLYAVVGSGKGTQLKALKLADGSPAWEAPCPEAHADGMLLLTDKGFLFPREDQSLTLLK